MPQKQNCPKPEPKVKQMLKKIKKVITASALTFGVLAASGCSDAALGNDSLLRPPRATGDKAAIQDIISSEAGGSYTLKYPQNGENRSAITLRNEDTDKEYAIALYATEGDTKLNVSIISFDKKKEWKCLGTFTHNYSGVDRVLFYDVNGDNNEEVIIGWSSFNSTQKTLSAYSMSSEEAYEMTIDELYDEMVITDLTGDSSEDMILLSLSTPEKPSSATMLGYSVVDGRPVENYSLELDPEVVAFSNIMTGDAVINTELTETDKNDTASGARSENSRSDSGKVSKPTSEESSEASRTSESSKTSEASKEETSKAEGSRPEEASKTEVSEGEASELETPSENETLMISKKGIVLDCKRSDNTFCTQMIYFDHFSEEIVDPLKRKNNINPTIRTDAVFSCDINGDEIIDIPVVGQMNASADENGANVCNLTTWYNYDAQKRKPVPVCNTVMNLKDGYYFLMPERWSGNITARRDPEKRELTFYLWNGKTFSTGDKLLTIYRYNEQQWEEEDHSGLIRLDIRQENSKAVYAAEIFITSAEEKLNITKQELGKLIFKL